MASVTEQRPHQARSGKGDFDAIIVGAGFSGLYQLHALRDRLGLKAVVVERGEGVGGTWFWNRYPGARCDSESHSYCYAFSDELVREWEWSERYPGHAEIRRYLNFVADKFDLKRDIRFKTEVKSATYDEAANLWRVETARWRAIVGDLPDHRRRLPFNGERAEDPRARRFQGRSGITPASGRMKASISPASASARSGRARLASRRCRLLRRKRTI